MPSHQCSGGSRTETRSFPFFSGSALTFDLPVATGEMVVCELDSQRFRFAHSPVFFRSLATLHPRTKVPVRALIAREQCSRGASCAAGSRPPTQFW